MKNSRDIENLGKSRSKIKYQKPVNLDDLDNIDFNKIRVTNGIFQMHFIALVKKRLVYFKRDKRGLMCEVNFIALLFILILLDFTPNFDCNNWSFNSTNRYCYRISYLNHQFRSI